MQKTKRKPNRVNITTQNNNKKLQQRFELILGLVNRNLKLLYNRSSLGILWALIKPLIQLAVFTAVFGVIIKTNIQNFASFLFVGLVVWNWFQTSLTKAAGTIISNSSFIQQPNFPIAILPVVDILTELFHLIIAFPVLFILNFQQELSYTILLLPLIVVLQFLVIASLSYFLAALNTIFRDTQHTINILLQIFFYVSGVFFASDKVPTEYRMIFYSNPMVHIIGAYRAILLDGMQPNWIALSIIGLASMALLPIGYQVFVHQSGRFVEEL